MPRCAVCGQDNPGGFRFCGACGASLAAPARAPAEERRLVTVLFCDLVGFTARSDQADPEDVGALLRPYHTRLRTEIERLGGTLDKFIGDGVMAVFGAPVGPRGRPRAGGALRAGHAGRQRGANGRRPSTWPCASASPAARPWSARARSQTEGVVGDVVNTASRLQGVAPAGGVVVGEATFRATSRLFDYEELGAVRVKGKADPVPVWRLLGPAAAPASRPSAGPAPPSSAAGPSSTCWKGCSSGPWPTAPFGWSRSSGSRGSASPASSASWPPPSDDRPELVTWRQGRCLPYGDGITFWALGEIVKAQAGILESDPTAEVTGKLRAALDTPPPRPAGARVAAGAAGPAARDRRPGRGQGRAGRAVRRLAPVRGGHGQRPPAGAGGRGPALGRPGDARVPPAPGRALHRPAAADRGHGPSRAAGTAPGLGRRHPGRDPDPAGGAAPTSRWRGWWPPWWAGPCCPSGSRPCCWSGPAATPCTPRSSRACSPTRAWSADGEVAAVPDIPVPETVHGLIAARLDALAPEVRALVQDAAVVGRVFWPGPWPPWTAATATAARRSRPPWPSWSASSSCSGPGPRRSSTRTSTCSGTPWSGTSPTPRSRGRAGPAATRRSPSGSRRWPGSGSGTWPRSSPTTTARRSPTPGRPTSPRRGSTSWSSRPAASSSWPGTGPSTSTWTGPGPTTARPSSWASPGTPSAPTSWSGPGGSRSSPATTRRRWPSTRRRSPTCAPPATSRASGPPWAGWPPSSGTRATPAAPTPSSPRPSSCWSGSRPAPSWSRPTSGWPATGSSPVTPPRPSTGPTRPWPWPTSWAGCPGSGPAPSTSAGWPAATSATSAAWTTSGRGWPSGWSWGRATTPPCSTTTWPSRSGWSRARGRPWRCARTGSTSPSGGG